MSAYNKGKFNYKSSQFFLLSFLFFVTTSSLFGQISYPKREMRGVWIATVANIDYPSSRSNSTEKNILDLKSMLRELKSMGINTVFFQIRTECDALYNSRFEPWSYWLTGRQGQAPEPFFDPLKLVIEESHKLGMELHAWFNPYRAEKGIGAYKLAENHVVVKHPEWILTFKDYKMLDPGREDVQQYVLDVVNDVLKNYDVDGVHFDDYFYPYGPKVSREDSATFAANPRGITNIDDWRRDNINSLMARINALIKKQKPWVKFGISPFGIVENKYAGTNGFESYKILYCDPLNWIQNRTVDYVLPQLYWEMNHEKAPFSKLLPWWASVTKPALLTVGLYSSSFLGDRYKGNPNELMDQLRLIRKTDNTTGAVFFSAKSLVNNKKNIADTLMYSYYLYPALQPLMTWKDSIAPNPPEEAKISVNVNSVRITWKQPHAAIDGDLPNWYVIYRFGENEPVNLNNPRAIRAILSSSETWYEEYLSYQRPYTYVITSLDRLSNESKTGIEVPLQFNK